MATEDDIKAQQELLIAHRKTLHFCLIQRAELSGTFCPPGIMHSINEARANIKQIKVTLRDWGIQVDDYPNDIDRSSQDESPGTSTSMITSDDEGKSVGSEAAEKRIRFRDAFSGSSVRDHWQVITGNWYVEEGVLNGIVNQTDVHGLPTWAVITLNKSLPADYNVYFRTKIITGELSELVLRLSNNRYTRVYLYEIDQSIMLGDGIFVYHNTDDIYNTEQRVGRGKTILEQEFPITRNIWYNFSITCADNIYSVSVGGQEILYYVDKGKRLSSKGTIGFISNGHMQYDNLTISW